MYQIAEWFVFSTVVIKVCRLFSTCYFATQRYETFMVFWSALRLRRSYWNFGFVNMFNASNILASLAIFGSIVFLISVLFSRNYFYKPWAKAVSIIVCACGLVWGGGRFILDYADISKSSQLVLGDVRRFSCGMGVGLLLAFIIAKPYKMVREESKPED
jgi:hypothetical protein